MDKCKDCIHYDDNETYPNTGYCYIYDLYVKENNSACEDFTRSEEGFSWS